PLEASLPRKGTLEAAATLTTVARTRSAISSTRRADGCRRAVRDAIGREATVTILAASAPAEAFRDPPGIGASGDVRDPPPAPGWLALETEALPPHHRAAEATLRSRSKRLQ